MGFGNGTYITNGNNSRLFKDSGSLYLSLGMSIESNKNITTIKRLGVGYLWNFYIGYITAGGKTIYTDSIGNNKVYSVYLKGADIKMEVGPRISFYMTKSVILDIGVRAIAGGIIAESGFNFYAYPDIFLTFGL